MSLVLRPARPSDAPTIVRIALSAFGQTFDVEHVRQILESGRNHSFVAEMDSGVVGFADNFLTRSSQGDERLELDLLAVDPFAQGLGAGTSLLRRCIRLAQELGVDVLRALVATDNFTMHSVCARCGLRRSSKAFRLYVAHNSSPGDSSTSHLAHFVKVDTLAYSGIWIEGQLSAEAIRAAMSFAAQGELRTVGAVVDVGCAKSAALLQAGGFAVIDDYHWWTLNPGSDRS